MNSLLGDRILKRFFGENQPMKKHFTSVTESNMPDAGDERVVSLDQNTTEEVHAKESVDSPETRQGIKTETSEGDNE
jgi:hypothetical protein